MRAVRVHSLVRLESMHGGPAALRPCRTFPRRLVQECLEGLRGFELAALLPYADEHVLNDAWSSSGIFDNRRRLLRQRGVVLVEDAPQGVFIAGLQPRERIAVNGRHCTGHKRPPDVGQ